ncbi:MAG: fluoride efflux transporter CrcB [Candidatus Dormibacteraceae bacterium]
MSIDVDLTAVVDPDVDVRVADQRSELARPHGVVIATIAVGGGIGASFRYGVSQLLPTLPGHFPGGTFLINVLGCFLIGVLMVLITEVWSAHRLLRPFFGVGILGGFTTFSTYALEANDLLHFGAVGLSIAYLGGTLIGAMLAVIIGMWATRKVVSLIFDRVEISWAGGKE